MDGTRNWHYDFDALTLDINISRPRAGLYQTLELWGVF